MCLVVLLRDNLSVGGGANRPRGFMGLRALLALCATPLVAGFGGLTYLRSIEDIEELHAPSVDTEGVKIDGVYDGRRNVNTYVPTGTSGLPFARALTPLQVSPQATEGACTAEEDVYYCGGDACDICDYAF